MGIHSEFLDVAIGLATVFFLASLAVSGINEIIEWCFRVRAKFLWAYLYDLVKPLGEARLPSGKRGITSLWRAKNDPRPGPAGQPAINADVDPLQRLARALAPIVAPELTGAKLKRQKTAIQHLPPESLAQALLEVFADVGNERITDALAAFGRTIAPPGAADVERDLNALSDALSIDDTQVAHAIRTAFAALAEATGASSDSTAATESAIADAFVAALEAVVPERTKGMVGAAAAGYARAVVTAQPEAIHLEAQKLASALIRSFPTSLATGRVEAAIEDLADSPLGATSLRLWEAAQKDLERFRNGLERHFDAEMDRLSGYYKRSIRVVLIAVALIVATAANLDAFRLAAGLWHNPDGRAALLAQADALIVAESTTNAADATQSGSIADDAGAPSLADVRAACIADAGVVVDATPEAVAEEFSRARTCIDDALTSAADLGVIDHAIWSGASGWWDDWSARSFGSFFAHLFGVLATATALIVGAPFWFDVVKRVTGARKGLVGRT